MMKSYVYCLIFFATSALATGVPTSDSQSPNEFNANIEIGYGHEHYSSPLVRFNNEGPVIEVVGRRHTSGDFRHISMSAMKNLNLTSDISVQFSAATWNRNFPNASDLNVGVASVDGLLRFQVGSSSVGLGPSYQHISSGGRSFRDRTAIQADWTLVEKDKGYTSIVLESGENRHSELFRDLDSRSTLLLFRKQFEKPIRGLDSASFEPGIVREINRFGYADLSNRQIYARFGMNFEVLGLDWNLGVTLQQVKFDGALIDELPARKDQFYSADINANYPLSRDITLRWSYAGYENKANVAIYDGTFRGNSLTIIAAF